MKNMQVKQKLIVSFLIVAIITAVVGVVGVAGLLTLNTNEGTIYNLGINGGYAEQIGKNIQKQRSAYRDLIIHINDASKVDSSANLLDTLSREYDDLYAYLDKNILTEQGRKYLSAFNDAYAGAFKPLREQLVRTARSGDEQGSLAIINSMVESMGVIVSATDGLSDYAAQVASDTNNKDSKTAYTLVAVSGALAAISVATAIFFALYLSGLISKPLKLMTDCLLKISTTGDLTVSKEEAAAIANRANDEIGQCIGACDSLSRRLIAVNENLGKVASGDLSVDMKLLSEQDSMGRAIIQMIDSLNAMFGELKVSSNQVSSGSGQMAHSAQELASGSTEQAASVQALSATVSEVREQVDDNAVRSQKALENCETAGNLMLDSMESMNRMMDAMSAIGESSRNITRVIKVIDDIAFQTNILALNAAVEAARAGQHGKGFAVVADEVRSLAAKSAEAAKETSALIEGSTSRVTEGGSIVEQTNASMKSVGVTMEENTILIKDMVQSLDRQKGSIVVVNQGMDRISTVVQANAATAQESAAAVEELSSQADVLNGIIARFKLKQTGNGSARALTVQKAKPHMSRVSSGFAISGGEQGGKY